MWVWEHTGGDLAMMPESGAFFDALKTAGAFSLSHVSSKRSAAVRPRDSREGIPIPGFTQKDSLRMGGWCGWTLSPVRGRVEALPAREKSVAARQR
jgi:hypothetical protein